MNINSLRGSELSGMKADMGVVGPAATPISKLESLLTLVILLAQAMIGLSEDILRYPE